LRKWNITFKADIQEMLAVCPKSSGYWDILVKLAEVNDSLDLPSKCKEMALSSDSSSSLKTVFILYALQVKYDPSHHVDDMVSARKHFDANVETYVKYLVEQMGDEKGLQAMLLSENVGNMADVMMLTFLRVWRGWKEQAPLTPSLASSPTVDEETGGPEV
jgi:hypothetical protein